MTDYFRITIRFLQLTCHGRDERGEPEWPPSPLRVFEALVAASAARWNERVRLEYAVPALRWLERREPPLIVAAPARIAQTRYRLYVPDNVGDKVAGSWVRGGKASIADYRTEKDIRPTHLRDDHDALHFLWPLADHDPEFEQHRGVLEEAARSITHIGWGVDMVAGDAGVISAGEAGKLSGERWRPAETASADGYRVPIAGTLDALVEKHAAFLDRLGPENLFRPVPPLSTYDVVEYRKATDLPARPYAAFSLLRTDASGFRPFDTVGQGLRVAGMLRHAASSDEIARALGWSADRVARFVLGHGESRGESHRPVDGPRLAFLPLPSIEPRGGGPPRVVTSTRRALITVFGGTADDDLRRLARLLYGSELIREDNQEPAALLSTISATDKVVSLYTRPSATWATVTPLILPGHDDPRKLRRRLSSGPESGGPSLSPDDQKALLETLDRRIDALLRKAIVQAGFSDELARQAGVEWRTVGFWPGTEPATRYSFPNESRRHRRLHVQITWRDAGGSPFEIPGPICLGGGRFHGIGLFAGRRL